VPPIAPPLPPFVVYFNAVISSNDNSGSASNVLGNYSILQLNGPLITISTTNNTNDTINLNNTFSSGYILINVYMVAGGPSDFFELGTTTNCVSVDFYFGASFENTGFSQGTQSCNYLVLQVTDVNACFVLSSDSPLATYQYVCSLTQVA